MNPTDTPRTDAVTSELDGITNDHVIRALRIFGREKMTKDGSLESWINLGAHRLEKAEAEVERLQRLRPTRDDVKELERELTKVTKERNDSTQAYIVLDASYKILRDSNKQLQKAIESI